MHLSAVIDLHALVEWGGYAILALIVFTETGLMFGFFLPGDSLLVTAGLFAANGKLDIVVLNVLLITMAIAGDATGYLIGRRLGPAIFSRNSSRWFRREHLIRTQLFYERHGGKTIVMARFIPILRTFAPVVAGVAGMQYRRFALFNITGAIGWVVSMTMTGYLLGRLVPNIERHIEIVIVLVIGLSLVPPAISGWNEHKRAARVRSAFRESVRQITSVVKTSQWDGSAETAQRILRSILAEREATAILREGEVADDAPAMQVYEDETGARVEIIAVTSPDPRGLSEAGREHAALEIARRFRDAMDTLMESLAQPILIAVREDGKSELPPEVVCMALWPLREGRLVLLQRCRVGRHDVSVSLEPARRVSDRISA